MNLNLSTSYCVLLYLQTYLHLIECLKNYGYVRKHLTMLLTFNNLTEASCVLFWICQEPSGPYWFLNIQELRGEAHLSRGWGIQAFLITVITTLFLIMSQMVKDDCLQLSLFDRDHLMFCKYGILIFIFAENYYSIYDHAMLIKTPLLHQSFGTVSFFLSFLLSFYPFSLSLSLFLVNSLGRRGPLSSLSCPGFWYPLEKAHCDFTHSRGHLVPTCSSVSPKNRTLLAFCVNQGVSASFSLLLSEPPGSSPLKGQHGWRFVPLHRRQWSKPYPRKRSKMKKKGKMVVWGGLTNSWEKKRKSKGEKEKYIHQNAEFQRIARRDTKAFLSDQCKEIEENNRMGKTRDLLKIIGNIKGIFHARIGMIKDRNYKDLTEAEEVKKMWQVYTEELYKKRS